MLYLSVYVCVCVCACVSACAYECGNQKKVLTTVTDIFAGHSACSWFLGSEFWSS